MKKKKLKIAVTGGIGGGKSSFCKFIAEKGYPVLSADEIAKDILVSRKDVKSQIIKAFGKEAYSDGKLNNNFLAEKVFSSPVRVKKINSIVHPAVISIIEGMIKKLLLKNDAVFVEAALIFEARMEELFDYIILVTADEEIRKDRLLKKGISGEDFERRKLNQISDEKKKKKSDFVFINNGSEEELKKKAGIFLKIISA